MDKGLCSESSFNKYHIAGQPFLFRRVIPELASFPCQSGQSTLHASLLAVQTPSNLPEMKQARGWLLDELIEVSYGQDSSGYYIDIPGAGLYRVSNDGRVILQMKGTNPQNHRGSSEALLGPPLILALAVNDTWCLHASAVTWHGKLIAFIAESGAGKSTLARYLDGREGFQRAGDDILPVAACGQGVCGLPRFPQLKLPPDQQPCFSVPESIPLAAVYLLGVEPEITISPVTPITAVESLIRGTAAARLFSPELLTKQLDFMREAACRVQVKKLSYPRDFSLLPSVAEAIIRDLQ